MKISLKGLRKNLSSASGFTLVELLVVIGILGVLAAVLIVLIDPVDKIAAANDTGMINTMAQIASAEETYAANHNGFFAANSADMVTSGDLRVAPSYPTGYAAPAYALTPAACTSGTTCTTVIITATLKSKRYTGPATATYRYETTTGKKCAVANATTACP